MSISMHYLITTGYDNTFYNKTYFQFKSAFRGIAGCENGCPADALSFISGGFKNFELAYIEGGILIAKAMSENGKTIFLKVFSHF